MERFKYYNIEAIIKDLKSRSYIKDSDLDEIFSIIIDKLNILIDRCNNGLNSVACIKLSKYIRELREIFSKHGLHLVFHNRVKNILKEQQ